MKAKIVGTYSEHDISSVHQRRAPAFPFRVGKSQCS